jgi:hypothetical protein
MHCLLKIFGQKVAPQHCHFWTDPAIVLGSVAPQMMMGVNRFSH